MAADLVQTGERLEVVAETLLQEEAVAVDTESNSLHRYPEQVCLVQISAPSGTYLIDPLAIEDASPLGVLFSDPRVEKVFHSADYDLRSLDREWGFRVRNVFDTSVAARFTGVGRLGLENVLTQSLDVTIQKDKRLQQSDWSIRPLPAAALYYAEGDVAHLLGLREALSQRLARLGRSAWVAEECARLEDIRHTPPDPPEIAFLSMRGSRDLDGRGLAVLRELVVFRDAEARRRRLPPYRVVSDASLLFLSQNPDSSLAHVPGVGDVTRRRIGGGLLAAMRAGSEAKPVIRPRPPVPPRPRPTVEQIDRLRDLKRWRIEQGGRLDLDPAVVWPMASLEHLAREPQGLTEEMASSTVVRQWQRAEFGASLSGFLAGLSLFGTQPGPDPP